MVTEEHITAFNWASTQELDDILAMTLRVNDYLSGMFGAVGITLVDFKIEFGRVWENDFSPRHPGRRDQPRLLPPVGHHHRREDGQGPLPPRPGQCHRKLHRGRPPPRHHEGHADRDSGGTALMAKVKVHVFLKPGVLDVQGKAVEGALQGLGWAGVANARVGKLIEFDLGRRRRSRTPRRRRCASSCSPTR